MEVSDQLKNAAEAVLGAGTPYNRVNKKVLVKPSRLVKDLARALSMDAQRVAPPHVCTPTVDEFERYIATLIHMRCLIVNGEMNRALGGVYKIPARRVAIPSFVAVILTHIGYIDDRDYGLQLEPVSAIDAELLLTPDDLMLISEKIVVLERFGFHQVTEVPRNVEGEVAFMAMNLVENPCDIDDPMIASHRNDHPVNAFLAAFIEKCWLKEVTPESLLVKYGPISAARSMIPALLKTAV